MSTKRMIQRIEHLERAKTGGFVLIYIEPHQDERGLFFLHPDDCEAEKKRHIAENPHGEGATFINLWDMDRNV
jgi:hypothetical protein